MALDELKSTQIVSRVLHHRNFSMRDNMLVKVIFRSGKFRTLTFEKVFQSTWSTLSTFSQTMGNTVIFH